MATSGLVLSLSADLEVQREVIRSLKADARVEVGAGVDCQLPIVTQTRSVRDAKRLYEHLASMRGINFVHLVCADLSEEPETRSESVQNLASNPNDSTDK